jgi:hypothetical protein
MTSSYRVLPAADTDLDDQAAYLAREANLDVALRFYDAMPPPRRSRRSPACPASASGDRRPIHAWKACGSGGSRDSRSTSSLTDPSRMASRLSASCMGPGTSTGSSNRKSDLGTSYLAMTCFSAPDLRE